MTLAQRQYFNPFAAMADGMTFGEATHRLREDLIEHRLALDAANDNIRGPFITTFTGRFYPFSPRASEVNIKDIAHALSMKCRYSGHGKRFYSVAEHCVHVSRNVPQVDRMAGLLHDAPEALSGFGDIASPVKSRVPFVAQVERSIYNSIAAAFGISPIIPQSVHETDRRICADEMMANMHEYPGAEEPLEVRLEYWEPHVAEYKYLARFEELMG